MVCKNDTHPLCRFEIQPPFLCTHVAFLSHLLQLRVFQLIPNISQKDPIKGHLGFLGTLPVRCCQKTAGGDEALMSPWPDMSKSDGRASVSRLTWGEMCVYYFSCSGLEEFH